MQNLLTTSLLLFFTTMVFGQQYEWVNGSGGSAFAIPFGFTAETSASYDNAGNIYLYGDFSALRSFNNRQFNLTSAGNNDVYVSKFSNSGDFKWIKTFGGASKNFPGFIHVNNNSNQILISGTFENSVVIGSDTLLAINAGNKMFVASLDTSGQVLWSKNFETDFGTHGLKISTDSSNHIYVAGFIDRTFSGEAFITKLSPTGNLIWSYRFGGAGRIGGIARDIVVDNNGDLLIAGSFIGSANFDLKGPSSKILNAGNGSDAFLLKLDSNANFIDVLHYENAMYAEINGVDIDANNNVLLTGVFENQLDLNPSTSNFDYRNAAGGTDVFIVKLHPNLDYNWGFNFGGPGDDASNAITVDGNNAAWITGSFEDSINYVDTIYQKTLVTKGLNDIFSLRLNQYGGVAWISDFGSGTSIDAGEFILAKDLDFVITTGYFSGMNDFDPSTMVNSIGFPGITYKDFIQVMNIDDISSLNSPSSVDRVSVFPNPTAHQVIFEFEQEMENLKVELYDITGKLIHNYYFDTVLSGEMNIEGLPGIYILKFISNHHFSSIKIIKQ